MRPKGRAPAAERRAGRGLGEYVTRSDAPDLLRPGMAARRGLWIRIVRLRLRARLEIRIVSLKRNIKEHRGGEGVLGLDAGRGWMDGEDGKDIV